MSCAEIPSHRPVKNVMLVNYSGYPDYTTYFLVDNGLAYLAAVLQARGFKAWIRDYVTVDMAERLYPRALMPTVLQLRSRCHEEIVQSGGISPATLEAVKEIEAAVNASNHAVAMAIAEELVQEISERGVDVVGFKLWSKPSLRDVFAIARRIRTKHPSVRIIAGGGHVDYFRDRVLATTPQFDAAAYGDGEIALLGYLSHLNDGVSLADIPNLIWRDRDGTIKTNVAASSLEFANGRIPPRYDPGTYLALRTATQKVLTVFFEDSRGCQFHCGFCMHPAKSGMLRLRAVDAVIDELGRLNRDYGFTSFFGAGSNTPFSHACRILEGLKKQKLDIATSFFQSLRDFRIDQAAIMCESNVPALWIGLESASDELLVQGYDKRRSAARVKEVCEFLNEAQIGYITSLVYPGMGETAGSRRETLEFISDVVAGHVLIFPPFLQPRAPWMDHPSVQWLDREKFLSSTQYGLEDRENRVLPPLATDEGTNSSVLIDGRRYAQVYAEHVRFVAEVDRRCGGSRGGKREFLFKDRLAPLMNRHNAMYWRIDRALETGEFDDARQAVAAFNELATAGSIGLAVPPLAPFDLA